MQQGMLFHSAYTAEAGLYVEQLQLTLNGTLYLEAFQRAWQQLIDQHDVLRTCFIWQRDQLLQVVLKQVMLPWQSDDWQHLSAEAQSLTLQTWLQRDRQAGFEMTKAPLLRCCLIHLGQQRYQFIWTHHHVLLDGWSLPLLLEDLIALYQANCQGQRLPNLNRRPYQTYIAWLQQQDPQPLKTFWQQTLKGFQVPTPLPTHAFSHEKPSLEVAEPQTYTHQFSPELTAHLQTWLRQQQLSLATLIYGVWGILLSRYSGEMDVVFGVTVSGRSVPLAGIEDMVGLFINTLPLRVTLSASGTCEIVFQQVQQALQDLQTHSYLPLVEIQALSEVAAGQNLFHTLVVIENFATANSANLEQGALPVEAMQVRERTNYPLMLTVVPGESLALKFAYDGNRFAASTLARMAAQLEILLAAIAADSSQSLAALSLLTPEEQQQRLAWNQTGADYPRSRCLHHLFTDQAARTPAAIAFSFADLSLTYQELDIRSNQLAHHLQALGVKPETLVGLCVERSLEMAIAVLAVLKAGGAYVPLDPSYPPERLAYMLRDSQVPVLLSQSHLTSGLPAYPATVVCLDTDWLAQWPLDPPTDSVTGENLAYVTYTSGSTGQPKGVQGLHRGAVNRLHWMWQRYPFQAGEQCCQKTALSFVDSVWEIFGGLLQGVSTLIIPDEVVKDSDRLVETLSHHRISRIVLVPSLLSALLETELDLDTRLKALKYWVCSGEVLPERLIEQFYHRFSEAILINLYGSSEVSADVTYAETARSPDFLAALAALSLEDKAASYVAPQKPEEVVLVKIWQSAFGLEKIGIQDSFFNLGGHQDHASKIVGFIHYLFDISLPLNIFQSVPSIEKLAAALGDREVEPGRTEAISKLLEQIESTQ